MHDPLCPMNNTLVFSNTQCECDLIAKVRVDERATVDAEWHSSIDRRIAFETAPDCWGCASEKQRMSQMFVCPECGNKRCPRASNHEYLCTGSNSPGQEGSRFEHWK